MRSCHAQPSGPPIILSDTPAHAESGIARLCVVGAARRGDLPWAMGVWRFLFGLLALAGVGSHATTAWAQEEIFVANKNVNSVTVYSRTANGDVAPLRTLSGAAGMYGLETWILRLLSRNPNDTTASDFHKHPKIKPCPVRPRSGLRS